MIVDYVEVAKLAGRRLEIEEIAACLGYDEAMFKRAMLTDPLIKEAIKKGRADAINTAALVVENAYNGSKKVVTDADDHQMKAALAYLETHSIGWRKRK
jgi:mannose-1-phosphate guanylyltransferase